ncbi:DUF5361 domain-containing protein [Gemella bergeri]
MLATDKEAVICDLAEYYHIYNYKDMPPFLVAIFCKGLSDDSRIKLKMSKQKVKLDTILLASIVDRLTLLVWFKTKDGQKGRNQPKLLIDSINKSVKEKEVLIFDTSEEFEKMKNRIFKEGG